MMMKKKINALFGKSFKPTQFRPLFSVAITRIVVVKNQHQARVSQTRSDVFQLLRNLDQHEKALLRVEEVIKEQNMVDVMVMLEGHCNLIIQRINLIEQGKECPGELKEAISSLIYAASRSGELPEVQKIRAAFTSHYGKEFVDRAIELGENCGVNPMMIQKLTTSMASLNSRKNTLKDIASQNGLVLQFEETSAKTKSNQEQSDPKPANSSSVEIKNGSQKLPEMREKSRSFSGPVRTDKFRDAEHASQVAFEAAAYAAAAARAAVELSRSDSHGPLQMRSHTMNKTMRKTSL